MTAYLYRMPSGIAGNVNRDSHNTIEPQKFDSAKPFPAFGMPGKIAGGKFVPLEAGDTAADIYGFLVRPYPTQATEAYPGFNSGSPGLGAIADVLRRGYMSVANRAGTPALNKAVNVRTANATDDQPFGGVEATAGADTVEAKAIFMDAGDADGNVEIAFNI